MRRRKPNDDRTQAQGLALDDDDDDERRVEAAAARRAPRKAAPGAGGPRAAPPGVDFFAAVAALRAAATAAVAALQKRRRRLKRARGPVASDSAHDLRSDGARPDRPVALRRPRNFERRRRRGCAPGLPEKAHPATHPDKTNGESDAFLAVGEAFRVLSDRGLREAYDAELDILLP